MLSAAIFDTQSGEKIVDADLQPGTNWGVGDLTKRNAKLYLHEHYTQEQWEDHIARWYDRILAFMWDGVPFAEGFIVDAPAWEERTNVLTVAHVGIPKILERRWMHGVGPSTGGGGYVRTGAFEVENVSIAGAVVRVLQRAYRDPISAAWPIPVQLPAVESGSFSKRYPFHEFKNAAAIIETLTDRDDGPQMDLRPILDDGKLTRTQRVGTLSGPAFSIFLDAEESAAESSTYGLFGEATATGIHLPGKGSEEDMRVGSAAASVSAGLARDSIFWDKTEENIGRLNRKAAGRLGPLSRTILQRGIKVKASAISPAELRIGSLVEVHSDSSRWQRNLTVGRVVGFTGTTSDTYTVQIQEAVL